MIKIKILKEFKNKKLLSEDSPASPVQVIQVQPKKSLAAAGQAPTQEEEKKLIVVVGDSIATGLAYFALCAKATWTSYTNSAGRKIKMIKDIPGYPGLKGGKRTGWVLKNMDLSLYQNFTGKKYLIIIAGTNDGLMNARGFTSETPDKSAKNIDAIVQKASAAGFESAVMKLKVYDGPKTRKKEDEKARRENRESKYGKNNSRGYRYPITDVSKHRRFCDSFNSLISKHKTFDMVATTGDGIHVPYNKGANTNLLKNALNSFGIDIKDIIVPSVVKTRSKTCQVKSAPGPSTPAVMPRRKRKVSIIKTNKDAPEGCYVNTLCKCIDRSVSGLTTVRAIQSALTKLAELNKQPNPLPNYGIDNDCGSETIAAIQSFQQQSDYVPPDRAKLRCDGCVGPNTYAALNDALKKASPEEFKDSKDPIASISGTTPVSNTGKVTKKKKIRKIIAKQGQLTFEKLKERADQVGVHPDILLLSMFVHSETGLFKSKDGPEGQFVIFNTVLNRVGSRAYNSGKNSRVGPRFRNFVSVEESLLWPFLVGNGPTTGHQTGYRLGGKKYFRPYSTRVSPRPYKRAAEKVKELLARRYHEGTRHGATLYLHRGSQSSFWNLTVNLVKTYGGASDQDIYTYEDYKRELGSRKIIKPVNRGSKWKKWLQILRKTSKVAIKEHKAAGIKWKRWGVKYKRTPEHQALRKKWRGFWYNPNSPKIIYHNWQASAGKEQTDRLRNSGAIPRKSTLKVFGTSKVDEQKVKDYIKSIYPDVENNPPGRFT